MVSSVPINQVLRDAIGKSDLKQWIRSKNMLNILEAEKGCHAYTKSRNKVKVMIRKSKREFERNIAAQSKIGTNNCMVSSAINDKFDEW